MICWVDGWVDEQRTPRNELDDWKKSNKSSATCQAPKVVTRKG